LHTASFRFHLAVDTLALAKIPRRVGSWGTYIP